MRFVPLEIPEVILIIPDVREDARGFFMESFHKQEFAAAGIRAEFVQDNHSASRLGVLRGLHYQIRQPQGKLIRVIAGRVFDVAVDLRRSSPSFGQSVQAELTAENKQQLWIPPGFAHGYYAITERVEILYKTTDYYAPDWERTLLWNDPALSIRWPLVDGGPPVISPRDAVGKLLAEAESYE